MGNKIKDRTGERYGMLVALRLHEVRQGKQAQPVWLCRCDCGNEKPILGHSLQNGNTKSCGCVWKTRPGSRRHGQSKSYTYTTWRAMKDRCYNPNCTSYRHYGGKGVKVCDEWQTYEGFVASMGERPKGMTLDRIDPDGDYEPGNCRWATARQQAGNLPHARRIEHEGKVYSTVAFAELMGVHPATLNWRIFQRGEDPHEAAEDIKRQAAFRKPAATGSCPRT
jgi:uncharacterized protein YkuJ